MSFIHRAIRRIKKTLLPSVAHSAFFVCANLNSIQKIQLDGPMV